MKEGWNEIALNDLCEFSNGLWKGKKLPYQKVAVIRNTNFTKDCKLDPSDIAFIDVEIKQLQTRTLLPGDIILERSGGGPKQPVGRVVLFYLENGTYSFSNFTSSIRIINRNIVSESYLHKYLSYFYFSGQTERLQSHSTGIRNLKFSEYKKILIPIPPLDEQQRIVQKLDAAFAAIDQAIANTEKNLEQPENLFQVIIDQSYDEISGAEKNILDSICELIVDCEHKTAPTELSGYPSIRTTNIGKGKINFDNVNYVSYDSYIQWTRRAVPQPDDLILAREAPAGNVAIIPEGYKVCLGQRTVLLRPKKDVISSKYLMYNLLSSKIRERLLAHSKGATVTHVNVKDIRNLDIGSIPEFDQQKNIINKIEEVDRITTKLIENYQTKIENLLELKQSILQKAFQGELT